MNLELLIWTCLGILGGSIVGTVLGIWFATLLLDWYERREKAKRRRG